MKTYAVVEVWTKMRVIEANDLHDAYAKGEPKLRKDDLDLSNWRVIEVPREKKA